MMYTNIIGVFHDVHLHVRGVFNDVHPPISAHHESGGFYCLGVLQPDRGALGAGRAEHHRGALPRRRGPRRSRAAAHFGMK